MAWSTTREDLIRRYNRVIAQDTTNWATATLQSFWDNAHTELTSRLCPPFDTTEFALLNGADTNSSSGNLLIARYAALLIYRTLPRRTDEEEKLNRYFEGDGSTENPGYLKLLERGDASLFSSAGVRLSISTPLYHTHEDVATVFSQTTRDTSGNLIATGNLDQFDKP